MRTPCVPPTTQRFVVLVSAVGATAKTVPMAAAGVFVDEYFCKPNEAAVAR